MEKAAYAQRILLSLRQPQHRRKNVGLRGLVRRYGNFALRNSYLPAALPAFGNQFIGVRDFQSGGLDLAFRGHIFVAAWMDSRNRFLAEPLGLLQRADD